MLQHFVVACFATSGGTDKHKTMSNLNSVIELNDLHDELINWLKIECLTGCIQLSKQVSIVNFWFFHSRKQIQNDIFEKRQIIL